MSDRISNNYDITNFSSAKDEFDQVAGGTVKVVSVKASVTFTFGNTEFDDTNNASITLVDTDGLSKTYVIKNDYGASSALEFNAGGNVGAAAENFIILVNGSNGHNGTIGATRVDGAITLTQETAGLGGNTSITVSNWNNITSVNVSAAFSGGVDEVMVPSAMPNRVSVKGAPNIRKQSITKYYKTFIGEQRH